MNNNVLFMIPAIGVYLIFMLLIGAYYSKRNQSSGDFYLGGRTLGPFVTAMSAEASDMSGWLLMGLPGLAYLTGCAGAAWTALGLALGTYINWLLVAKRLRTYTSHIGAITIPDFFSKRYHDEKNILNLVSAIIIIVFFVPYTASGFAACGKLFNSLFGIDYKVAMLISAFVIVGYTTLGGFLAASTTDFIQSIVMTFALLIVMFFGVHKIGGLSFVLDNARSMDGFLSMTNVFDPETGTSSPYRFIDIISTLAWGLGYFGMPHILLRFMAINDTKKLTLSRRVATIWVLISLFCAIFIGIIGNAVTKFGHLKFLSGSKSETVIVEISNLLSQHGIMFACIAGVIISGILASTMSTADSQLLVASSGVSKNIFADFFGIKLDAKKEMLLARSTVIVISIIGCVIASNPQSSVFEIVSFAWAGFGATFGPVVLCALFWKRSNKTGALAGMLAGFICIFLWKYIIRGLSPALDIYELLPAFLLALIVNIFVSLITEKPSENIKKEFSEYIDELRKVV